MKKKIAALLVSALLSGALCVTAFAAGAEDHDLDFNDYFNPTQFHDFEDNPDLEDIKTEYVAPSCEKDGYVIWRYKCSDPVASGTPFHEIVVEIPGGHQWSSESGIEQWGKVIKEPTCSEEGLAQDYCTVCGIDGEKTRVIDKLAHEPEEVLLKPANCKDKGEYTYQCEICGANLDEFGNEVSKQKVYKFDWTDPGDPDDEDYVEDEWNLPHDWDKWVTEEAATCAEEGLKVQWCRRCGMKRQEIIPVLDPVYVVIDSHLDDCYTQKITERCSLCDGKVHEDRVTYKDVRSHVWTNDVYESEDPDCTHYGYTIIQCDHYDEIPDEHDAEDEWTYKTVSYKDEHGKETTTSIPYHSAFVTKVIAPNGHTWGKWIKRHGVDENGNTHGYWLRTCQVCGATDELITDQDVVQVVPATCTEDGYYVYLDGSKEVIPATGHTEVEIPAVEPTADSVGYTAGTKCSVCGEILVAPEEIPALKNGFVKDEDEEWRLYEDGSVKEDFTGIYEYDGGEFYLKEGVLQDEANGLNLVTGTWYFLSQGQIQRKDGFAEYDDNWFMIDNGELDADANGLYTYKTDEGEGVFLFAAGRLRTDVNGLWQDHYGTYGDADKWYFLANGQVVDYTGVAEYNGSFFVVEKGVFNNNYNGTIEYDGATFNVVNGQLYGKVA